MSERLGILVLNHISASGLSRLPAETYSVGKDVADPVAISVALGRPAHDGSRQRARSAAPASAPTTSRSRR
jgi:hypothetical protein